MTASKDTASPNAGPDPRAEVKTHGPQKGGVKSTKLDRTLRELENAFSSWESLDEEANDALGAETSAESTSSEPRADDAYAKAKAQEQKFRKRTRTLLNQLRNQIEDLSDD